MATEPEKFESGKSVNISYPSTLTPAQKRQVNSIKVMHLSNGLVNYVYLGGDLTSEKRTNYIHVATFLPLKSWKYMFSFQRLSSKVLKQIKENEGAINYAVKGNLLKKYFWTLSIWRDNNSLRRFIMEEPHATLLENL